MHRRIYLDNAATSFPKAPGVAQTMSSFITEDCLNPNRTESGRAFELFERIYSIRETIAKLYGHDDPASVVFTRSVTESLNWVIKGLFTKDDHVIVTSSEHNAVMRPLVQCGIPFSRIPADKKGYSLMDAVEPLIRPNTKAMTRRLYEGILTIDGLEIVGARFHDGGCGSMNRRRTDVISTTSQKKDIAYISSQLLERCGIETRVGLHCSPAAHRTIGTFPQGTLRFSPEPFTTADEIDETIECLKGIMNE